MSATKATTRDPLSVFADLMHMSPADRLEVLRDDEQEAWQVFANTQVAIAFCGALGLSSCVTCSRSLYGLSLGACLELFYGAAMLPFRERLEFLIREADYYRRES